MTETFTLAHFSDVHMSPVIGFGWRYWNAKRALGYLNWQRKRRRVHVTAVADRLIADARALRPDHIAITGDLVNLGLPAEHPEAYRTFVRRELTDHVDLDPARLHGPDVACADVPALCARYEALLARLGGVDYVARIRGGYASAADSALIRARAVMTAPRDGVMAVQVCTT